MNGYTGKLIILVVGAVFALAAGLGQDSLGRLNDRVDTHEERINACHVDTAVIRANSDHSVSVLDRLEKQLDRIELDIDRLEDRLESHADPPLQQR